MQLNEPNPINPLHTPSLEDTSTFIALKIQELPPEVRDDEFLREKAKRTLHWNAHYLIEESIPIGEITVEIRPDEVGRDLNVARREYYEAMAREMGYSIGRWMFDSSIGEMWAPIVPISATDQLPRIQRDSDDTNETEKSDDKEVSPDPDEQNLERLYAGLNDGHIVLSLDGSSDTALQVIQTGESLESLAKEYGIQIGSWVKDDVQNTVRATISTETDHSDFYKRVFRNRLKRLLRTASEQELLHHQYWENAAVHGQTLHEVDKKYNKVLWDTYQKYLVELSTTTENFRKIALYKIQEWIRLYNKGNFKVANQLSMDLERYFLSVAKTKNPPDISILQQSKLDSINPVALEAIKLEGKYGLLQRWIRERGTSTKKLTMITSISQFFEMTEDKIWQKQSAVPLHQYPLKVAAD